MRKRILSMLMVFCMMLSLLPTTALAGEIPNGYVDGGEVTTTGLDLNAAPDADTYYKAGDGYALWEPSNNTLTLQDATIDTTTGNSYAIALLDFATGTDVTIVAEGNNVLTATNDAIVQNAENTVIEGNGTLTVTSVHTAIHCNYGVSLTITGNVNAKFDGQDADVVVGEDLNILGNASVTAHGIMGLSSGRNITIDTAGDVDAPVIMSDGTFNYTAGNMTGSWVVEERDNFLNCLNSVYGSLKLTKDTTISYRGDVSGDDGLTIAEHAILTIPAGITLTVQDGTAITNNGTIINNGTIAFPAGTTVTEILALGITGTGIVIIGNDTIVVGGSSHPYGGDVSTTGLNLSITPTVETYYKAGSGYALYTPSNNTLTLNNATIDTAQSGEYAITLPQGETTLVAEGDNVLKSTEYGIAQSSGNTVIEGSGTLTVTAGDIAISCTLTGITITGDVKVQADGGNAGIWGDYGLNILGNASVTATGSREALSSNQDITINTTGTVNAPAIEPTGTFFYTSGNMTGSWVWETKLYGDMYSVHSVYGSIELTEDKVLINADIEDGLTVTQGASLTIPAGITLTMESGTKIINNGTIVNNGTIAFPAGTAGAEIGALTIEGTGTIKIGDKDSIVVGENLYPYGGDVSTTGLDLSVIPTVDTYYKAGSGYVLYTPSNNTLTLNNATIHTAQSGEYAITLPQGETTLVAEGDNVLKTNTYGILHNNGNTVIEGNGTLAVKTEGQPIYFNIGGTLTVKGNVKVQGDGQDGGILADQGLNILEHASVTAASVWALFNNGDININTTGTVNAPKITVGGTFIYTLGDMTGSWVLENKGDYFRYQVNSVYGNVELTEAKTLIDASVEDGLTVTQGASLTIPAGITITMESGTKIINNGTIVNNGTIAFPASTTGAEILALNITGTGMIKIGDKTVAVVNGVMYPNGGDISSTGVDLSTASTDAMYYTAGNGYVLWTPSTSTLTMHNSEIMNGINKPLISLAKQDVTVVLEGDNFLTNTYDVQGGNFSPAIQQGTLISSSNPSSAIPAQNYKLTVSGSGTLCVDTKTTNSISTDGTFVIKSGTLKGASTGRFKLKTTDFKMEGGTLLLSGMLMIYGNANVTGGNIVTPGGLEGGILVCVGNFNMSGGTVKCGTGTYGGMSVMGELNQTGGTLNALNFDSTDVAQTGVFMVTVYGDAALEVYDANGNVRQTMDYLIGANGSGLHLKMIIPSNASLTIHNNGELEFRIPTESSISDYFTNNGTLVNNGEILLPEGTTDEGVLAAVGVIKPTGTGLIKVGTKYYSNSGQPMNIINAPLDFSVGGQQSGAGYSLTGGGNEGYLLSLEHVYLTGDLSLPAGVPVIINTHGTSVINGDILFPGGGGCNVDFSGGQPLFINGSISGGIGGDTISVTNGAQLGVTDGIGLGSAPGQGDTLIVSGRDTLLSVIGGSGSAVFLDTLEVSGGAMMTVHANGVGIRAGAGGISLTGGSTLNVGCDYGVYIVDGKLNIDSTSKLITNADIAPFCVVDTTSAKVQSDTVSLPGIPSGTKITSAVGTLGTYWSLAPTSNTLGVSNENSTQATLTGAVTGAVTFVAAAKSGGSSSGGGGSANYYSITATAGKGGTISPSDKVTVVDDGSETFTITANKGYEIKDVLVDGVSVGNVTTYTFDKVAKAHTITASFEEIKEVEEKEEVSDPTVSYIDVKNSDWFKTAVDYVTENALMSGTGDGKFSPNISTTRGMIVTILWRLEGEPSASKKADFTDVAQGQYYTDAVAWAAENKIVEGYGNGQFGSQDTITREQMASILYRYAKFKGYDTTQGTMVVSEFSDYGKISGWALESVTWAVNAGLISGVDGSQLNPGGNATRAQAASILMRYCENMDK